MTEEEVCDLTKENHARITTFKYDYLRPGPKV